MRQCLVCGRRFNEPPGRRGRPPETCSEECHRLRKNQHREESRQRAAARGCPDNMHGTSSGYSHYKCTCNKCRLWSRLYKQGQRKKAAAAAIPHEGEKVCPTLSPPLSGS